MLSIVLWLRLIIAEHGVKLSGWIGQYKGTVTFVPNHKLATEPASSADVPIGFSNITITVSYLITKLI